MGLYHGRNSTRFRDVFIRTILGFGLAFVVLSVLFYLWPSLAVWRDAVFVGLPASLAGAFLLRVSFLRLLDGVLIARGVPVLGPGEHAAEVAETERPPDRSDARGVGHEGVITCITRWSPHT